MIDKFTIGDYLRYSGNNDGKFPELKRQRCFVLLKDIWEYEDGSKVYILEDLENGSEIQTSTDENLIHHINCDHLIFSRLGFETIINDQAYSYKNIIVSKTVFTGTSTSDYRTGSLGYSTFNFEVHKFFTGYCVANFPKLTGNEIDHWVNSYQNDNGLAFYAQYPPVHNINDLIRYFEQHGLQIDKKEFVKSLPLSYL